MIIELIVISAKLSFPNEGFQGGPCSQFYAPWGKKPCQETLTYSCMVWICELTLIEKIQLHLCALHEGVVSHRLLSTWWLVEVFRRDPHRVSPSSLSVTSMRTMVSRDCIFILVVFRIDPHRVSPSSLSMTSMRTMVSRDCIFILVFF